MASSLSRSSMLGSGPSSRGANGSNSGVLRIQQELNTLMKEPVPFIFVSADESDISKITALIVGPLETPYAVSSLKANRMLYLWSVADSSLRCEISQQGGFFHFDIRIGAEYPMKPPSVQLRTTDGGRVRFNPNLYSYVVSPFAMYPCDNDPGTH